MAEIVITGAQIAGLAPHARAEYQQSFLDPSAPQTLSDAGVSATPLRVCHFLAQVLTESATLTAQVESLDYSAKRLVQVWPNHFPTIAAATPYAHNQAKLGDFIYGTGSIAKSLGNTNPGDGFLYRGRGLLQITGRAAYARYGPLVQADLIGDPDLAFGAAFALAVACSEWAHSSHGGKSCNELADEDNIVGVTYAINGGQNGLATRQSWLAQAKAIWMPG